MKEKLLILVLAFITPWSESGCSARKAVSPYIQITENEAGSFVTVGKDEKEILQKLGSPF